MNIGKLPNEVLQKIVIENIKNKRDEVLVGSGVGKDNALIDFGDEVCVLSTDPITGASKGLGKLAINISCNDVAASGGEVLAVLLTILAPENSKVEDIENIMKEAGEEAEKLNIEIAGGHTEVTDAVNRFVVTTTAIGKQTKEDMLDFSKVIEGDRIFVSKSLAIEGTSILAYELEEKLIKDLTEDELLKAKNMDKYLSVTKEGRLAGKYAKYMHDITEGGLLGAVWEASMALKKGVLINKDNLPIDEITIKICNLLKIDPLKLISSGSMLIVVGEDDVEKLKVDFEKENIRLTEIGIIKGEELLIQDGEFIKETIESPGTDELYKVLEF